MSKVICALSVSVDGYITGHDPGACRGLVLLGAGRSFFQQLPKHVNLRSLEVTPAPGVTHLHYEVVR